MEIFELRVLEAQTGTLEKGWFLGLFGVLHAPGNVITFNPDTLVEHGVEGAALCSWDRRDWSSEVQR